MNGRTRILKAILKPSVAKLVLALGLLVLSSGCRYYWQATVITDIWSVGFPFVFQETWGPCPEDAICRSFSWFFLFLDAALWYAAVGVLLALVQRK